MMSRDTLIEVDWARFDPWRVQPVRHHLAKHPLLQLPSLMQLAQRQESAGRIRTHSNEATAGTPFNMAPRLHPNRRSALESLADVAQAQAWVSLLNVQTDSIYRSLVDDVLDSVQPRIEAVDPGMCYRAGWVFIASPGTVTPFHIDKEHNFILQIAGRKRIFVWEPDDRVAVSEAARDKFHAEHNRDLIVWTDVLKDRAHVFDVEPGMGAYMPSTSPHLVENGDGPSITASFTYYTQATRRDSLLHVIHHKLRQRGFDPAVVGASPMLDALTYTAGRAIMSVRNVARGLRGQASSRRKLGRYAEHLTS
jgi:hypothetical protein